MIHDIIAADFSLADILYLCDWRYTNPDMGLVSS